MHICTIGMLRDYMLDKDNIKGFLDIEADGWNRHANTMNYLSRGIKNYKPLKTGYKSNDFIDSRKSGSVTMFSNCPYCGKKIDWKAIKQSVNTPHETSKTD